MTGPEHYREAQRLLSQASFEDSVGNPVSRHGHTIRPETHAALIARAQVHAQLAAVAAHVASQPLEAHSADSSGFGEEDWDEWMNALSPTTNTTTEEN